MRQLILVSFLFYLTRTISFAQQVERAVLYFNYGKGELTNSSILLADSLFVETGKIRLVELEGHTDNDGSETYNLKLSKDRAMVVQRHLVYKGIGQDRIYITCYGESRPVAPNDTPEGKQKNRRVEISIRFDEVDTSDNTKYKELRTKSLSYASAPCDPSLYQLTARDILYFDYGRHDVTVNSKIKIDDLLSRLVNKNILEIILSGHTDGDGSVRYNIELSQERVDIVQRYLLSQGVNQDRFKLSYYGKSQPISSNDTEAGKQKNRRVEMVIKFNDCVEEKNATVPLVKNNQTKHQGKSVKGGVTSQTKADANDSSLAINFASNQLRKQQLVEDKKVPAAVGTSVRLIQVDSIHTKKSLAGKNEIQAKADDVKILAGTYPVENQSHLDTVNEAKVISHDSITNGTLDAKLNIVAKNETRTDKNVSVDVHHEEGDSSKKNAVDTPAEMTTKLGEGKLTKTSNIDSVTLKTIIADTENDQGNDTSSIRAHTLEVPIDRLQVKDIMVIKNEEEIKADSANTVGKSDSVANKEDDGLTAIPGQISSPNAKPLMPNNEVANQTTQIPMQKKNEAIGKSDLSIVGNIDSVTSDITSKSDSINLTGNAPLSITTTKVEKQTTHVTPLLAVEVSHKNDLDIMNTPDSVARDGVSSDASDSTLIKSPISVTAQDSQIQVPQPQDKVMETVIPESNKIDSIANKALLPDVVVGQNNNVTVMPVNGIETPTVLQQEEILFSSIDTNKESNNSSDSVANKMTTTKCVEDTVRHTLPTTADQSAKIQHNYIEVTDQKMSHFDLVIKYNAKTDSAAQGIVNANHQRAVQKDSIQTFKVSTNEDITIQGAQGTTVSIPKNSLVDKNGVPVQDDVTVQLQEIYSKSDMLKNNIATASDGDLLESGGMINLQVKSQDNKEVFLDKNATYHVEFPTQEKQKGMELFYGDHSREGMNWQLAERMPEKDSASLENQKMMDKYVFKSSKMGWLNCDRFTGMLNKTNLRINLDDVENTNISLVFKRLNSVLNISKKNNDMVFTRIPIGEEATLVAFSKRGNYVFFADKTITIEKNVTESLTLEKLTEAEFQNRIKQFN